MTWTCPDCGLLFTDFASLLTHQTGPDMAECRGPNELLACGFRLIRVDQGAGRGRAWRMPEAWRQFDHRDWFTDLIRLADIAELLLDALRKVFRSQDALRDIATTLARLTEASRDDYELADDTTE